MLRTENKLPKKRNKGAAKLALKNNGLAYPCYSDSAKAAGKYPWISDFKCQQIKLKKKTSNHKKI